DITSSRFEVYDSLAKVYTLYATLNPGESKLAEFAFVLNWPNLKPEEKRALYSKHACHELHFFLAKKDPAFFRDVVRPYLANKKDKTFLDRWLLEEDLSAFVQPWQYGRLNTVERVLLAQRLPGEPAKTARHLGDLLRLQPPGPDRFRVQFDTALLGRALATKDELGRPVLSKTPLLELKDGGGKAGEKAPHAAEQPAPPAMPSAASGLAGRPAAPQAQSKTQ